MYHYWIPCLSIWRYFHLKILTVYWLDTWTQFNKPQICWRHYSINNLISLPSSALASGSLSTVSLSITIRLPHLSFRAFFPGRSSGGSSSPGGPITLPALALGLPFVSCCWQFWILVLHLFPSSLKLSFSLSVAIGFTLLFVLCVLSSASLVFHFA